MLGRETSLASLSAGITTETMAQAMQVASRYEAGWPDSIPGATPMNANTEMSRNESGQQISMAQAIFLSLASCSAVSIGAPPPRARL